MNDQKIRKISTADLLQLKYIGERTFADTFSSDNSEANMKTYLENEFTTEKLLSEINDPYSEFYFAEQEDQIIGYLKVNFETSQTEFKEDNSLEIERIYVLKEYHGKQVGQMLFEKAFAIAQQKKVDYIWLGVWEENPRAIRFYEKNGFIAFDKHIFHLGNDPQTDILMKQVLR